MVGLISCFDLVASAPNNSGPAIDFTPILAFEFLQLSERAGRKSAPDDLIVQLWPDHPISAHALSETATFNRPLTARTGVQPAISTRRCRASADFASVGKHTD